MTVHRKCVIVLAILCANRCITRSTGSDIRDNNVSEDSDEDENIKQALVLVNLLKHEYVKALRENNELRMRSTLTEESTCAPGDRPTSISESTTSEQQSSQQPAPIPMGGRRVAVVKPFQPAMGQNAFQSYQFYRRRVPVDYYYDGSAVGAGYDYPIDNFRRRVPFRRQGPTNASNDTSDPVTPDLDTPDPNTSDPNTPHPNTLDPDTPEPDTQDPGTPDPAADPDTAEADDAYPEEAENTLPSNEEEDIVQAQIASELKVEMKAPAPAATYGHIASYMNKDPTTKMKFHLIKPTLKVYSGGSTRYPIPLPENHAFCYTNPRNKLCRTSI